MIDLKDIIVKFGDFTERIIAPKFIEEYNDYNDHVCERSNISVPDNVADDNVLRKKAIQEGIFGDIGIVDCVKNSD